MITVEGDRHGPILTVDSGLGGLSVYRHIRAAFPNHRHVYIADDDGFPYGDWEEGAFIARGLSLMADWIDTYRPSLVVIACNTASTVWLGPLRARFEVPFVGTVPAIKPAVAATTSGMISVLATPATVRRDYTRGLIDEFAADCDVTLVGAPCLADIAERYLKDGVVDLCALKDEVAPVFHQRVDGVRTDTVVLACTHYPLLMPVLDDVAPWPVKWLDPGPAIARQAGRVLSHRIDGPFDERFHATSGVDISDVSRVFLNR
ncbi:MAG: glutamate racemase [Pseudomonadota bacterium]